MSFNATDDLSELLHERDVYKRFYDAYVGHRANQEILLQRKPLSRTDAEWLRSHTEMDLACKECERLSGN